MKISLPNHPLFSPVIFSAEFPMSLNAMQYPTEILSCLEKDYPPPFLPDETVKRAIRDLLRFAGYKPAGRGKPSSEYLLHAFEENSFPKINLAVDIGNIVSLFSGIPVSVIDCSKIHEPFSIDIAKEGESYPFNSSGQTIDLNGLLCLYDSNGPCANGVKDAQRTKTDATTTRTLTVLWGSVAITEQVNRANQWYKKLLSLCSVTITAE